MMEKIKNIIDGLCALIKGIFMEKKDNEALPCEPEYFFNKAYTNVVDCLIHNRNIDITSKENRLLLSIIQTLIHVVDAIMVVNIKLDASCLNDVRKHCTIVSNLIRIIHVKDDLRDKFYDIMKNEDNSCDNSILKSIKIVL